jgi:hypothetical protein
MLFASLSMSSTYQVHRGATLLPCACNPRHSQDIYRNDLKTFAKLDVKLLLISHHFVSYVQGLTY